MITKRNSNDYLHTEIILEKITEYDIFKYYCPNFNKFSSKFCSDLRKDNTPSVSIINWNSKLLYKDFGHPDHTFDCFNYVVHKFGCTFYDALRIIDNDFNLKLASKTSEINFTMGYLAYKREIPNFNKKVTIIQKKKRIWNKQDENFWSKYFVGKEILHTFDVEPISHYWINGDRFTCKSITYAYKFGNKFKIYAPYEKENKWASNTNKTIIQGYKQLPIKGNLCIITSSLKDVMCLFKMGIPAIALQSEMQMPEEKTIEEIQKRFSQIALFYDNDFDNPNNPGQTMANKIQNRYKENYFLKNIKIPEYYKIKDLSDYIAHFKSIEGLKTLIELQI